MRSAFAGFAEYTSPILTPKGECDVGLWGRFWGLWQP